MILQIPSYSVGRFEVTDENETSGIYFLFGRDEDKRKICRPTHQVKWRNEKRLGNQTQDSSR